MVNVQSTCSQNIIVGIKVWNLVSLETIQNICIQLQFYIVIEYVKDYIYPITS
jgi:hypothetical protein